VKEVMFQSCNRKCNCKHGILYSIIIVNVIGAVQCQLLAQVLRFT